MRGTNEQQLIREYNQAYGKVLGSERKKRKLTLGQLSYGIMSRKMLDKVEKRYCTVDKDGGGHPDAADGDSAGIFRISGFGGGLGTMAAAGGYLPVGT